MSKMTRIQRTIVIIAALVIFYIAFFDINGDGLYPNQFRYYLILIGATLIIAGLLYLAFNKKRDDKK